MSHWGERELVLDIPRLVLSSGLGDFLVGAVAPRDGLFVGAVVVEAAVEDVEEIISYCRVHLAHYKCPTSAELVDSLPRDPNGKVRKRELREKYWINADRKI
jgi:long-chain acyl-CoA synthetase